MNIAILISGGGSNMARLIETRPEGTRNPITLVVSNDPSAGGLAKAQAQGVKTEAVDHRSFGADGAAFEDALHNVLVANEINLICLAGFMRILSPGFVARWEGKILNIHPSLLPKYPGLDTHARAISAGDGVAGCSVHIVTGELDAGPVLGQATVPILSPDTPTSLAQRVLTKEHQLYPTVLERFLAGKMDLVEV